MAACLVARGIKIDVHRSLMDKVKTEYLRTHRALRYGDAEMAVPYAEHHSRVIRALDGVEAVWQPFQPAPVEATGGVESAERLRSELLAARADIIKLEADVKAANQRLAEKAEADKGASRPDNSAKLEQQLASTRSRVQQLNKALADAKLREVAIDLALINVVPSPSPRAPR